MSSVSLDNKGKISSVGSSANAESTSSRFVSDLLPGSKTLALTAEDSGAGQVENSVITLKIQGISAVGMPVRSQPATFSGRFPNHPAAFLVDARLGNNA
tara:strand:- start:156 stop:452 length:297 start_codon:yes stop_codon:yes gene_type:complete